MDNDNVNLAVLESNNNMALISRSLTLSVSSSISSIDLEAFDLDEALAVVDGEGDSSRRLFEAWETFVSKLPTVNDFRRDDVCSVCMERFGHGDTDRENKRVPCGHVYHSNCITVWLEHCNCCPLCRHHISLF